MAPFSNEASVWHVQRPFVVTHTRRVEEAPLSCLELHTLLRSPMATVEDTANPTEAATPAPNIIHDPPSQPASPLPKRTKVLDPAPPLTSVAGKLFQDESLGYLA